MVLAPASIPPQGVTRLLRVLNALTLQVSGSLADWMTAIGTCAAAFVALGVALWSWRRVGGRPGLAMSADEFVARGGRR